MIAKYTGIAARTTISPYVEMKSRTVLRGAAGPDAGTLAASMSVGLFQKDGAGGGKFFHPRRMLRQSSDQPACALIVESNVSSPSSTV